MFSKKEEDVVVNASVYDNTSGNNNAQMSDSIYETKQQNKTCRDLPFAILLYANLIVIAILAILRGTNPFTFDVEADQQDAENVNDYRGFMNVALATCAFSIVLSGAMLFVLMSIPGLLIKVSLFASIGLSGFAAVLGFYFGSIYYGVIMALFFFLTCCYAYCVWNRIPFASANLKTGCAGILKNCGVTVVSYLMVALALGWTILWIVALLGVYDEIVKCEEDENGELVCSNPNYFYMFLLFVSYFFTHQVIQNTIHVTVAGVIGNWWFVPSESGFCSSTVTGSLFRALTTSFGSICFGSLLVAIIEATRQLIQAIKSNDDMSGACVCVLDCILGCIESLVEYFNKWAFIYVGLYGYGYCEAGKNVIGLFKDRGWEAFIADDLVGMALGILSLVVGLLTGCVALFLEDVTDWFDAYDGDNERVFAFVIGLVIGLVFCSILMSCVASSVNATIVLFAEAPAEFEQNHPELSSQMRAAWQKAYPGYDSQ